MSNADKKPNIDPRGDSQLGEGYIQLWTWAKTDKNHYSDALYIKALWDYFSNGRKICSYGMAQKILDIRLLISTRKNFNEKKSNELLDYIGRSAAERAFPIFRIFLWNSARKCSIIATCERTFRWNYFFRVWVTQ